MASRLAGKVVVVTGGGRGIGRGIAIAAAAEGARVVVADYGGRFDAVADPSREPADEVVATIGAARGDAVACYEDVATMDGAQRAIDLAVERFGRLDGIVCAAGIAVQRDLWELSEDEWDAVIRVHLKGHFACTRAALPHLLAQGDGRLVYFTSSAAISGPAQGAAYAAAKAGVLGLMWSASRALVRRGVTVNAIMPGAHTRLVDNLSGDWGIGASEAARAQSARESEEQAKLRRDPANVAPAVVYLLSDVAKAVTGQVFSASGYQITRLERPAAAESLLSEGPWKLDDLFERFPETFGSERRLARLIWPP